MNGVKPRFGAKVMLGALLALCLGVWSEAARAVDPPQPLSPFTSTTFQPDGEIGEFIRFGIDSQLYFVADPALETAIPIDPDFGAIRVGTTLTHGVFVTRDNSPEPNSANSAGQTGYRDLPGASDQSFIPTGFNIGRVFASYNPDAYHREGAYFLAMDVSAPAVLDSIELTQPVAFDVDGDGSLINVTELLPQNVTVFEAPSTPSAPDGYAFELDTDGDTVPDVTVFIGERLTSVPFGSWPIDPGGNPQDIPCAPNATCRVRRYVLFDDISGTIFDNPALPSWVLTQRDLAVFFLDANGDGMIDYQDVGVDSDLEIVIRHVDLLPNNPDPSCISIIYLADSFDDVDLGGGGEDQVTMTAEFPVPDIEVTKTVRCLDEPDSAFRSSTSVVPGSTVVFGVTIANQGNRDLDVTIENDVLSCVTPATATLVPGSCTVVEAPPGFDGVAFCNAFETAINAPFGGAGGFPMRNAVTLAVVPDPAFVGTVDPFPTCPIILREQLVFTYRATIGPEGEQAEFCDPADDCTNGISVSGRLSQLVDPILAPSPPTSDSPTGDAEEEDCNDAACCQGAVGCVPNDGFGDVADEFSFTVFDNAGVVDTNREEDAGMIDDNVVSIEIDCRSIALTKEVRLGPNGPFTTELDRTDVLSAPAQIEYRYSIVNGGEVDELTTLKDIDLCADVSAIMASLPGDITFGACNLCLPGAAGVPGVMEVTIAANATFDATFTTSCVINFNSEQALRAFTRADEQRPTCQALTESGDTDVLCYRNCAEATAVATNLDVAGVCPGNSIRSDSFSTVCHPICDLEVVKQVRCLDNCTDRNPTGALKGALDVSPGSCVEYAITIENTSTDIPLCKLRISDSLGSYGNCIVFNQNGSFSVDGVPCDTFPFLFNLDGSPFDWDPVADCGLQAFQPGSVLTITFSASIPDFAVGSCAPLNEVTIQGVSDCRSTEPPRFSCEAGDQASIQVLEPALTCLSKEWAVQWDRNGDCVPDGDFTPFTSDLNLRGLVLPIMLRMQIQGQNTGDVPLNIRPQDDALLDCLAGIEAAAVADPLNCEIGQDKLVMPGASGTWTCDILVETVEALRALDACDGAADGFYTNQAVVLGTPVSGGTNICVPDSDVVEGLSACSATVRLPEPCQFDTSKDVKCADDPDLAYAATVASLPGSVLRYRIKVANTSASTPMPRICIEDQLDCSTWLRPGSVSADIDGFDVTACVAVPFSAALSTGNLECYTFADCRPGAPRIGSTETLTITFDVQVPPDFVIVGADPDCTNAVTVNGRTEVCVPVGAGEVDCAVGVADASFDVLVPELTCDKTVRADLGDDGIFDLDFAADLPLPCDGPFPLRLQYQFLITNTGETPLIDVEACDGQLRADAIAAGLTVGPCIVPHTPEGCGSVSSLLPGESTTALCDIIVPSRALWESFAGLDGDADIKCYDNQASARARVDTAAICDDQADTSVISAGCSARVCLAPECHIAVTKQVRCLDNCGDGNPTTQAKDVLQAAGGSCLEFEVNITNTDDILPVCRLRIADALSGQPGTIVADPGSAAFRVGETVCPVPAGFNAEGTLFEWDPVECGLAALEPGQTLTFTFSATIPVEADTTVTLINTVSIEGAPACPADGPTFCCRADASATVELLEPRLTCTAKEWALQWDQNGDCTPDEPFGAFSDALDLREAVFPILLRMRIGADNTGPVPLNIAPGDPQLTSCVTDTRGISFADIAACELSVEKLVMPGASEQWVCDILVESADAMRVLDGCDGQPDGFYRNTAGVSGILTQAGLNVCVPQGRSIQGDDACSASLQVPQSCRFETSKQVKCADEPDEAYVDTAEALPGSTMRFRIQVANTGGFTKMPRVCVRENLMCLDWILPETIVADIAGEDVTACVAMAVADSLSAGDPECFTFAACRPAAPWIAPGETLTITFDAAINADYEKTEVDPDCTNEVVVDGFAQVCAPVSVADIECPAPGATASFDVLIPRLECSKEVRADLGDDASFDTPFSGALSLPCDTVFPVRLEYRIGAINTGETPLSDTAVCDNQLLIDAQAAGLVIGPCDLSQDVQGCATLPPLGVGSSATGLCQILIPDRAAWERFASQGGSGLSNCHVNSAVAVGTVDNTTICDAGADRQIRSTGCKASVCVAPECQVVVTSGARCVSDCEGKEPPEPLFDRLEAAPGSCVEFFVEIRNASATESVCRLRIADSLGAAQSEIIPGTDVRFQVGQAQCPVPVGFNLSGQPFDWDPVTCGLTGLDPGQALTFAFDATIPEGANPATSRVNTVTVNGSPSCVAGPNFCCIASTEATVDVLAPLLEAVATQWAVQWDHDGDCEPDGVFGDPAADLLLDDEIFPVVLRLSIQAGNNGGVPLDVVIRDDAMLGCVTSTPDASVVPGACELGAAKLIPVGEIRTWLCEIRVETVEAMRALDACDGSSDDVFRNTPQITGTLTGGATDICVPPGRTVVPGALRTAQIQVPQPCALEVSKTVTCLDGCPSGTVIGTDTDLLEVVTDSYSRFALRITNTSQTVRVPRICISDSLSCGDWMCAASLAATIDGADVTADFAAFVPNGARQCFTLTSRAAAPWLAPGETLTISFDVQVPDTFDVLGVESDCRNTASVEVFTEVCSSKASGACTVGSGTAAMNVKIPAMACQRSVAVDLNDDGTIDLGDANKINMSNPSFPVRLIHRMTIKNTGELPIQNATVCDDNLVADALAAGISVGPCSLCTGSPCAATGDTCAPLPEIGVGQSQTAVCELVITDRRQWLAFTGSDRLDSVSGCRADRSLGRGSVAPQCSPPDFDASMQSQPCEASVCFSFVDTCPTTKATFDIWNQNEVRFAGTERCIFSWDEQPLSLYTQGGITNHFLRSSLQTTRGRARIEGLADAALCGGDSMPAPLIGVAAKMLNFGRAGMDVAGLKLVGQGEEPGSILHAPDNTSPFAGSVESVASGTPVKPLTPIASAIPIAGATPVTPVRSNAESLVDSDMRSTTTNGPVSSGGSLLVYPKVEIKWDASGQLIQDTFLSITNDIAEDVRIQLYLVQGDRPVDAVLGGDPPEPIERSHNGCNWVGDTIALTGDESTYWSVFNGLPKGVAALTVLDSGIPPGRPDPDVRNHGGRVLRGYVLAWAVNLNTVEIRWNHLSGAAVVVNYRGQSAWEYEAWSFEAIAGVSTGSLLNSPPNRLDLDGVEYEAPPSQLVFDFISAGSVLDWVPGDPVYVDTDLTLWVALKDLRSP